jgi:hypothetical protein
MRQDQNVFGAYNFEIGDNKGARDRLAQDDIDGGCASGYSHDNWERGKVGTQMLVHVDTKKSEMLKKVLT